MCRRLLPAVAVFAALVAASGAAAASAPTATTGPVASVGPKTATVSGTVNPNGTATMWHVEYGTTTAYGSQTAATSAGSGTSAVSVSAALTGLTPGTTYHYRVVATSTAGTGSGADGILTTSAAPEADTGAATSVTSTSATLNGTVNPNGRATTWYFEYGTSTNYGTKTPTKDAGAGTAPVNVSAQITALTPNRTYHFRLVAVSDAGTTRGTDQIFSTSTGPTVATTAASSVGTTSARLNGTINPNGAAATWYFEYGTSTSYGTKTSTKTTGSGTNTANVSASISGLTAGTSYHFRLVATNASGTSTGGDQTFTTSGPPLAQTGAATAVSAAGATLTGTVDPRGHTTSWYFEFGTSTAYGQRTATQNAGSATGPRAVSVPIGGLSAGTTYHFRLVASSSAGTTNGSDASFTTSGPAATIALAAPNVVYGHRVVLSGTVGSKQADESVALFARRFGSTSFASLRTVLTNAGGTWAVTVAPAITTTYKAVWKGVATGSVTLGVRPAVSLRVLSGKRFATRVVAARSFAHRIVQLQRRTAGGRWLTISRVRLDTHSSAVFHPRMPRGTTTLRVAISANQVGGGYLAGFSRTIVARVRA